jgi:hypothetical protein
MADILQIRDFDVAGVQLQKNGPVVGFVKRKDLQHGVIRDHLKSFTEKHLIADSTPLAGIFSVLKSRESVFVLIGPEVKGIVTRADLNKPSVRIYLFGLISLLEMHLTFWIRDSYPEDAWREKLSPGRVKQAEKIQNLRKSRNQGTSLVDCLQFCDKQNLALSCENFCENLEMENHDESFAFLSKAEDLRNLLAHSQQDIIEGSSWEELFQLVKWIEYFVHRSDDIVDRNAIKASNNYKDGLWASA